MQTILSGIILFVQDVDKLKRFYIDHLQLSVVEETPSEWVLLKAGTFELGLHKVGAEYTETNEASSKSGNNSKVIFDIDADIFAVHKELVANGVILREIKTWDNFPYWVCDGEDPEGNVFQLRMKKGNG